MFPFLMPHQGILTMHFLSLGAELKIAMSHPYLYSIFVKMLKA